MAFPSTPLALKVELFVDGAWTDITADALVRSGITITRGLRDEGTRTDPSKCSLSIRNINGKYSPRNPNSPYYGLIGRNTPIRVSVGTDIRFVGEVSSWPSRWDITGQDVWVPIEAAGILRRLGQGSTALKSTLYRGMTYPEATSPPVAYWPCEDAPGATSLASGIGGPPMKIVGSPKIGAYTNFIASEPIPLMNNAEFTGDVPTYTVTGQTQVRFLLAVPQSGATDGQTICRIRTTGTAQLWHLNYKSGGALQLQAFADNGGVLDSGAVTFNINGKLLRVSIELGQSGANVNWNMLTLEVGQPSGLQFNGTLNGQTVGQATKIVISPQGGLSDVAVGHVSVQNSISSLFDLAGQMAAWNAEKAGRRIERLCAEEGIPFVSTDNLDNTIAMGPQRSTTLLELLTDAAETDMGILYEPRTVLGLAYRTRESLYNQPVDVALNYAAKQLSPPLEPVDDDQATRNDITVSRYNGSSARVTQEAGPLSAADPPAGVGRYDESVTINNQYDAHLLDHASWRLHVGTVDEARYPTVTMNLTSPALSSNAPLTASIVALDIGDRITISNQPAWLPPGLISLLAWGYSETLEPFGWEITANCAPESPWQVAVYDTDRYGTDYSTLTSSITSSATSFSVTTNTGPKWTIAAGDFPLDIMIGGERMTVAGVSGTGTTQTFTVTRSINGVVKSHSAGESVCLFKPAIRAL
ncbi:hypothetical protein [Sphaerisporangium rhizosphaerae]|uniref:Minor tail protein n=1 Tax=Sphaerisporangium rhizosphaerae TaxID=2269375 RepID=A0ABW2P1B0_9ACTN